MVFFSQRSATAGRVMRLGAMFFSAIFFVSSLGLSDAQAKRFGGGGFVGKPAAPMQRAAPPAKSTPQQTPPSQQAAPAQQPAGNTAAAAPGAAKAAAPAAGGASRWMAPLAGLAAGLGLAALASHLGLGEELMGFLMILLLVGLGFFILRMVLARGRAPSPAAAGHGLQPALARSGMGHEPAPAATYQPSDAAALGATHAASARAAMSEAEIDQFLQVARAQFLSLQKLWDSGDLKSIEAFCTPQMAQEIAGQLATRGHAVNYTSVVQLEVDWMGMQDGHGDAGQSVDEAYIGFRGLIREASDAVAEPFHEVWLLQKPKDGSDGWLLAGISQHS